VSEAARNFDPRAPIERLLEAALAPVDPPAGLVDELETKLTVMQTAAIEALEEMSDWELAAMRDPRNWVRPAVAIVAGTAAGTALVLLQVRRGRRQRGGLKGVASQGGKELLGVVERTRGLIR
jgi:hypothetical protein